MDEKRIDAFIDIHKIKMGRAVTNEGEGCN